ncbi:hypothetical protein CHISP_2500 [Chitinispirillum alkaliphilum]|nr:hypothetical protein CHISP_2500 [Chitinispirillum alkaliphilum]
MKERLACKKGMFYTGVYIFFLCIFTPYTSFSQPLSAPTETADYKNISAHIETGFISVLRHRIQFGEEGTLFDYRQAGGQDVLFPTLRFSLDWHISDRHTLLFLYQPLTIETVVRLDEDLLVDTIQFAQNSSVKLLYNFPFYRVSYLYDFLQTPLSQFALGASLQIRNATITFRGSQGDPFFASRDVGLVPAVKIRAYHYLGAGFWVGAEADGVYAPIRYLNLSDQDITGAILDASLRGGVMVSSDKTVWLNLRYLGGGAQGTVEDDPEVSDGFTKNWLNTLFVTLGFTVRL